MTLMWLVLLCLIVAGCQQSGPVRTVDRSDLVQVALEYRWPVPLTLPQGHSLQDIWLIDENLYALTDRNTLVAFDARQGLLLWSHDIAAPGSEVYMPVHVDDMTLPREILNVVQMQDPSRVENLRTFDATVVHSIDRFLVISRRDGRILRDEEFDEINVETPATAAGSADGQRFFFPATDGTFYSVVLASLVKEWRMSTEDIVYAPLKYWKGTLFIGDGDGYFAAINPEPDDNRIIWERSLGSPILGSFVVDDRGCFIPTEFNRLYGFSITGRQLEGYPVIFDGTLETDVQPTSTSLFQYAQGDALHAVDIVTGQKRWSMPEGRFVVGSRAGDVYVIDKDNNLRIVDEIQGTIKAQLPMTGFVQYVRDARQDVIYAVSADSKIYCIQKAPQAAPLAPGL
jgi:outer membrane protein assembly factor BamB